MQEIRNVQRSPFFNRTPDCPSRFHLRTAKRKKVSPTCTVPFSAGIYILEDCALANVPPELLNAALEQTSWDGPRLTEVNWRKQIKNRIESLDWDKARADVKPFLERTQDVELVKKEVLVKLLMI